MKGSEKYKAILGDEVEYNLVPASNKYIRDVLKVPAFSVHKDPAERIYYATEGEVVPTSRDDNGNLKIDLIDEYDYDDYWYHLAEALFIEDLGLFNGDGELVKDRADRLDKSEVRRAFDDYMGKWGATAYEVKTLLQKLSTNHKIPEITALVVQQMIQQLDLIGTPTERS